MEDHQAHPPSPGARKLPGSKHQGRGVRTCGFQLSLGHAVSPLCGSPMHLPGLVTITITPEPEEVKSKGITATTLSGQGCTFMVSCLQTAKPTLLGDFPSKFVWKASPPTNPPHFLTLGSAAPVLQEEVHLPPPTAPGGQSHRRGMS